MGNKLAAFIGSGINFIIIALFLITVAGFAYTVFQVTKLRNKIDEGKTGGRKEYTGGGIKKEADVYTWEDNLGYLEKFNDIQLVYSIFEQLVPVFPLLGILGTVSGLIMEMEGGLDQIQAALSLSMLTTFWGLIAAIFLKVVDAVLVSRSVNRMALYFDTFEQNYQMAKDKFIQENEK